MRKRIAFILSILMIICAFAFTFTACGDAPVVANGISLNKTSITLEVDKKQTLIATVTPADAIDKTVYWSSSNESVAFVNINGEVTARGVGNAVITATTVDGKYSATCSVTVIQGNVKVTGIRFNSASGELELNRTCQLTPIFTPENASNKNVTWSSDNEEIATVSQSGVVTGISLGETVITATTVDGNKTATFTVTVINVKVASIELSSNMVSVAPSANTTLTYTILPNDAFNKDVTWSSDNEEIATVNQEGVVTGVAVGETVVKATTADGYKVASCTVKVSTTQASSVTLNVNQATLNITAGKKGEIDLVATIDGLYESATWSSDDETIATVSALGKVKAVSAGTTTIKITVVSEEGTFEATCTIITKVVDPTLPDVPLS